jgi:hypothetical protein
LKGLCSTHTERERERETHAHRHTNAKRTIVENPNMN